ncbi:Lysophospholipase L1 [Spirosomataceae bacterium TFI 002]|nr:Lysophospholipase L1 [Spirosomataceae bacterium TFI 002]
MRQFIFITFFLFSNSLIFAQDNQWKGFEKLNFEIEGRQAWLVKPAKAMEGNPWVWRARFPGWHTEMDSMLVSEGYHLAYIKTDNEYGSPKAMKAWDAFYVFLTSNHHLNKKVALEGVSRGGLFIYNWAKANPSKVACIYAEAPVCDFKSWPGGFGSGPGSSKDWEQLKAVYGFANDDEAKAYQDLSYNGLEKLANARVPILHMIGLLDEVVPYAENSKILINKYIELGGPATAIACTKGVQKLQGHHFPIETPRLGADFIKYHVEQSQPISSSPFHNLRGGIKNAQQVFEKTKKGRIAFLGGSITQNGGWRDSLMAYFIKRFPDTEFDFVAAGISSTGSTPAAFRLERDVLSKGKIDLLFEEAAVNDFTNGRTDEEQIRAMEGIVRHLKQVNPATDIVHMHFVDPEKIEAYRKGVIPKVIQNHESVAVHYNNPSINLAKEVQERIDHNEFTWEDDFKNLHPSPFGQGLYANSMIAFLDNAFKGNAQKKVNALPKAIDTFNYSKGKLVDVREAKTKKGWKYIENWSPNDGTGTRPNYTNVPMLVNEISGSSLSFSFTGSAVGIAIASGKDAGVISYRIDKGEWKNQNLFTQWSKNLHLPWFYTLAADLDNKKHTLEVKIAESKDERSIGNACRIRYFYVNGEY